MKKKTNYFIYYTEQNLKIIKRLKIRKYLVMRTIWENVFS